MFKQRNCIFKLVKSNKKPIVTNEIDIYYKGLNLFDPDYEEHSKFIEFTRTKNALTKEIGQVLK